jgi:phage-related protein
VMYVAKFDDKVHVLHCFQKRRKPHQRKISILQRSDMPALRGSSGNEEPDLQERMGCD